MTIFTTGKEKVKTPTARRLGFKEMLSFKNELVGRALVDIFTDCLRRVKKILNPFVRASCTCTVQVNCHKACHKGDEAGASLLHQAKSITYSLDRWN